jgi:hypothetical protein
MLLEKYASVSYVFSACSANEKVCALEAGIGLQAKECDKTFAVVTSTEPNGITVKKCDCKEESVLFIIMHMN